MIMLPLVLAVAQATTYDFNWHPRPRQVTRYHISLHVDLSGAALSLTADLIQTVGVPDATGAFKVSTVTRNVRAITDADTQAMPDEPASVERFDRHGRRLSENDEASDWFATGLGHCTDFVPPPAPVPVGGRWSHLVKPAGSLLGGRLEYRLTETTIRNKAPLLHVRYTFTESRPLRPVRAEGYFFIDPRDYSVVDCEALVHGVKISPDLPASPNVEVHLSRT